MRHGELPLEEHEVLEGDDPELALVGGPLIDLCEGCEAMCECPFSQ